MTTAAGETIQQILARLQTAGNAGEVFGVAHSAEELARAYRRAAKTCHPDLFPHDPHTAREAFVRLARWYEIVRDQLRTGTYSPALANPTVDPTIPIVDPTHPIVDPTHSTVRLRRKDRVYEVDVRIAFQGDFCHVYRGALEGRDGQEGNAVAVKVARYTRDDDLLAGERAALHRIREQVDTRHHPFFPDFLDGFVVQQPGREPHAANVLSWVGGAYTLDEIRRAYPAGVDPKDVAWMWRRLLVALGAAHRAGIVHGAVLPPHVCVLPREHGLVLIGWTCAVEAGRPIPAIGSAYETWYPKEVMAKEPATAATDVAMGARCMLFLLGEDAPAALSRFFRGCLLPAPRQRPHDAWALLREFDDLLARLWGPRTFHPFSVPAPCPR